MKINHQSKSGDHHFKEYLLTNYQGKSSMKSITNQNQEIIISREYLLTNYQGKSSMVDEINMKIKYNNK
jgi:hypothetical protein